METLALIQARMEAAGIAYTVETEGVEQEDWQNGWRKYYHPMDIGKRLAIVPSWQEYDTDRVKLILDPGLAFGTGGHETTSLCLEALDERVRGGERVLDIGTGSGILAIAALKLGAGSAEGVDIDPVAVRTAGENAALNGVADKLTVLVGDLSDKASGRYDIITANIVANAIISLAPAVPGLMAENATFIASGIIDSRKDEVIAALEAANLTVQEVKEKRGWECIVCKKRNCRSFHDFFQLACPLRHLRCHLSQRERPWQKDEVCVDCQRLPLWGAGFAKQRLRGRGRLRRTLCLTVILQPKSPMAPPPCGGRCPSSFPRDAGQAGDTVILCDGNAVEYTATITGFGPETVEFRVEPGYPSAAEPSVEVTLFVGYPKRDKLEQVIRHGVELGCTHFVPFFSRYCVAAPKKEEQKKRALQPHRL